MAVYAGTEQHLEGAGERMLMFMGGAVEPKVDVYVESVCGKQG